MQNNYDPIIPLIDYWKRSNDISDCITFLKLQEAFTGELVPFPENINPDLLQVLKLQGVSSLYHHQVEAFQQINQGKNIVINTGTASGKTLAFILPILNHLMSHPKSTALLVYPTKALAYDQYEKLVELSSQIKKINKSNDIPIGIYDGDTPKSQRSKIRKQTKILLTNPDMLHFGIMPYHTNWENFFSNMKFLVMDEIHTYRGVFGSHVSNVLRRLRRIFALNGSFPQYISTTATIGNPKEFAEKLFEQDFSLIDRNGSPNGKKYLLLYNPPVINEDLGVRRSSLHEAIQITSDILDHDLQALIFQQSRRSVEISLRRLREIYPLNFQNIQAYRSGYLASERRYLEADFRNGNIRALFSTNALELGVDIGGLSAVVIVGYPGTIASTLQQMGRAGRHLAPSMALLVAGASPIDQYLIQNPEYLFENSPENVLIDPNNPLILLQHLRCAAHELMFMDEDPFGSLKWDEIETILKLVEEEGNIFYANQRYMWISDLYPAAEVPLRNIGGSPIKLFELVDEQTTPLIGQVDYESALWMIHPGATYLHMGENYLVKKLDLENSSAFLEKKLTPYYTEPKRDTEIEIINPIKETDCGKYNKKFGDINVTTQVVGFRERLWDNNQLIQEIPLDLPPLDLQTEAVWITLSESLLNILRESESWNNDPADYGKDWVKIRTKVLERDHFTCQLCQTKFESKSLHIHHKTPIRMFSSISEANQLSNLITLCGKCHQRVEMNVKIRSGLSGAGYIIRSLAPLFLMCDFTDIDLHIDPSSKLSDGLPICLIYDTVPYGIGLSQKLYDLLPTIFRACLDLAQKCSCDDGCPSCIGPVAENGYGSKKEAIALLTLLAGSNG